MLRLGRYFTTNRSSPALCGLRSKAQQGIHRKRFWQIRQRVKLREPTRADAHGRKDHHRKLLALSLHDQRLNASLTLSCTQDIPACLVGKVDIQDDQIKEA